MVQDFVGSCCKTLVRPRPLKLYHIPCRGFHQTWLQQMLPLVHLTLQQMFGVSQLSRQTIKEAKRNRNKMQSDHSSSILHHLFKQKLYHRLLTKTQDCNIRPSMVTVLCTCTSTLSVLRNPFMLPLPYRISKSVPFFW